MRETTPTNPRRSLVALARRWLALALLAAAFLVLLAWSAGRLANDRTRISQYLWWLPSVVVLPLASVLAMGGLGVTPSPRPRRPALFFAVVLTLAWVYVLVLEWRVFADTPAPTVPPERRLRLFFWNIGGPIQDEEWHRRILDQSPEVVVLRPGWSLKFSRLFVAMGTNADANRLLSGFIDPEAGVDFLWERSRFAIITRARIVHWASISLDIQGGSGLDPRRSNMRQLAVDPGAALFLVLDTRERLGRNTVLWLVDLPSDLSLWRQEVMLEARAMIDAFLASDDGEVWSPDQSSRRWVAGRASPRVFAEPDLIMGDLNTPRGSASIGTLVGGLTNAHTLAGKGPDATFPRRVAFESLNPARWRVPLWHIDQAFVGPRLRAIGYDTFDPQSGTHRAQVVEVEAR